MSFSVTNKIIHITYISFIFTFLPYLSSSQDSRYSIEVVMGSNFNFSKKKFSNTSFNLIEPLMLSSSLQGIYISEKVTSKYDLLLGVEFYQSGIRTESNTSEQKLIHDFSNLASGEHSFSYRHFSFPVSIKYNLKKKQSNFYALLGGGYTYSRNGNINYTCFYGGGATVTDTITPIGSTFCVTEFNKNSNHNFFLKLGLGYDYEIKRIGKLGIKTDYNFGINFMDEVLYEITFLNGDNYKTWIGNKGSRFSIVITYKREIKTAWNNSRNVHSH